MLSDKTLYLDHKIRITLYKKSKKTTRRIYIYIYIYIKTMFNEEIKKISKRIYINMLVILEASYMEIQ